MINKRSMKCLAVLTISLAVSGCYIYYNLPSFYADFLGGPLGDVIIQIELADISEPITFDQDHMTTDTLEYAWGVLIDVDNDPATGDVDGFDTEIRMFWKTSLSSVGPAFTMSMIDTLGPYLFQMEPAEYLFIDGVGLNRLYGVNGNSIYIAAEHNESIFDGRSPEFRSRFYATYNNPSDPGVFVTDYSPDVIGNGTESDTEGDVSYSFIDIVRVRIQFPE